MKDSTGVTVHSKEFTLHAMPEVVCRSILNYAKPFMMQVEGKYHMKRKEKEGNERMPGVLRLTETPSEEPLRTHSKIGNEKRYCSSLMHAIHYGNGHHLQQHEHSHLKWQPRGSSWTASAGLFPYILLKGNDEGSCIRGYERGN